jgi:myo-inositol catabolism protein IolC
MKRISDAGALSKFKGKFQHLLSLWAEAKGDVNPV